MRTPSPLRWLLLSLVFLGTEAFVGPPSRIDRTKNHSLRYGPTLWRATTSLPHHGARRRSSTDTRCYMAKKKGYTEIGIQTAQFLMDSKKQERLKEEIGRSYPLVPKEMIDAILEMVADAFQTVAPKELQLALRPGWIEKNRSKLSKPIVLVVVQQEFVQDFPLSQKLKTDLITKLVDLAIDLILKEADELLTAPEVRLAVLENEIEELKEEMGFQRLWTYRLKKDPVRYASIVLLAAAAVYVQTNATLMSYVVRASTFVASVLNAVWSKTVLTTRFVWKQVAWVVGWTFWRVRALANAVMSSR